MTSQKQKIHNELRKCLEATNAQGRFALNKEFDDWNYYLKSELWNEFAARAKRQPEDIQREEELTDDCNAHIRKYAQSIISRNVLAITHPLYAHLTHAHHINSPGLYEEFARFNERFFGILNSRGKRKDFGIVLLEDPRYYAAATSMLLERKIVDNVFLTNYDSGCLRGKSDLELLKGKRIFMAGAYNGKDFCLDHSIQEINSAVPKEQIWALKDLVIDPDWDSIFELCAYSVFGINSSRTITFEQFLKKLKLEKTRGEY